MIEPSGRELMESSAHDRRVKETAQRIFPFFREMVLEGRENPVSWNREQVLLYMEALKSKHFMDCVENESALNYDLKVQVSHLVSGINKGWTAIRRFVYSRHSDEAAAIALQIFESFARVLEACGIRPVYVDVDAVAPALPGPGDPALPPVGDPPADGA